MKNTVSHHKEEDFILLVLRCCYECGGEASHEDVRDYIEHQLDINDEDMKPLKSDGMPRWHRIVHNLKSHGKIQDFAEDVKGGFRLTEKGALHVKTNFEALPEYNKPWKRIDRNIATRETVCEKWGNRILFDLRAAGNWSQQEIIKDVDSKSMNMTQFEEKYTPDTFKGLSPAPKMR